MAEEEKADVGSKDGEESKGEKEGAGFGQAGFGSATFSVSAPPVFGSGTGKGADGGDEGGTNATADPEAECKAEFTPVVELSDVETSTGEESEQTLFESKAKLYRYLPDKEEWKERGTGTVRILQAEDRKVRCLMRRNKTLKICANFYLIPGISLAAKPGSETTLMWSCLDYADEEEKMEMFAMRFPDAEKKESFRTTFEQGLSTMAGVLGQQQPEQQHKSTSAASAESNSNGTAEKSESTQSSTDDAASSLQRKEAVEEVTERVGAASVSGSHTDTSEQKGDGETR